MLFAISALANQWTPSHVCPHRIRSPIPVVGHVLQTWRLDTWFLATPCAAVCAWPDDGSASPRRSDRTVPLNAGSYRRRRPDARWDHWYRICPKVVVSDLNRSWILGEIVHECRGICITKRKVRFAFFQVRSTVKERSASGLPDFKAGHVWLGEQLWWCIISKNQVFAGDL